jgi:hypothetical protein
MPTGVAGGSGEFVCVGIRVIRFKEGDRADSLLRRRARNVHHAPLGHGATLTDSVASPDLAVHARCPWATCLALQCTAPMPRRVTDALRAFGSRRLDERCQLAFRRPGRIEDHNRHQFLVGELGNEHPVCGVSRTLRCVSGAKRVPRRFGVAQMLLASRAAAGAVVRRRDP